MKKLSVIVAILICFGISASALDASYDIDFDTGEITVQGQIEEAKANKMVSIEIIDENNQTVFVDILDTDSNGSFHEILGLPLDFESGLYSLIFGAYGKSQAEPLDMIYSSPTDLQPIVQNANSINDPQLLKPTIDNGISVLTLPEYFYNTKLSDAEKVNVASKLIAQKPEGGYTSPTQIKNVLYNAIAEEVFTAADSGEDIKEAIEKFNLIYEIKEQNTELKLYAEFKKFGEDQEHGEAKLLNVYKLMSDYSFEDRFLGFDEAVFLTALSPVNVDEPADIAQIIATYGNIIDVDLTYYNLLDSDYAALKLVNNNFDSIAMLENKIKEIYDNKPVNNPVNNPIRDNTDNSGNRGTTTPAVMPGAAAPMQPVTENKDMLVFDDIENVSWAKESILALNKKGIVKGDENGNFNPYNNVTRAEYILMLVRAFELFDDTAECEFLDLAKDHFAHSAIASAYKKGIISGIGNDLFTPEHKITRQDLAVMTIRAAEAYGIEFKMESMSFQDEGRMSEYAKDSVLKLVSEGIINGMGDGTFAPLENATRAQAAKILNEVLKKTGGQ